MPVDLAPVDAAEQREKGADPTKPTSINSLLDFQSSRLKAYEQTFGTAEDRRAEIDKAKAAEAQATGTAEQVYQNVVVPALVRQVQASRLPVPTPPAMAPQPPVPSQQARPFMDVSEKNALGAVVSTLGMMAQMAMAGKAPVAALGALTGAMDGWHQGDRERADRQWREYLGEVDRIARTNRDSMAMFDAAMKTHTTNLQAAQAEVVASLYGHGHYEAAARVARDGVVQAYGQAADLQNHIDKVWGDSIKLIEAHETRDLKLSMERQRLELQDAFQRNMIDQRRLEYERRVDADAQRTQDRAADRAARADLVRENMANRRELRELFLSGQTAGMVYDHKSGELHTASKMDLMEDREREKKGLPPEYTFLPNQTYQSLLRLTIAPPMLDRLDTLIDRIMAAAPGENLSAGLIAKLKRKAGISEDIQEFSSLNADALIEVGTALSGRASPFVSIVRLLKGEALPELHMTGPTAKKALSTVRTTVNNRIIDFTKDPDSPKKLSQRLERYGDSPTQQGVPDFPKGFKE